MVSTGSQFKILVQLQHPCFVYVLYHSAEQSVDLLFPATLQQFDTDYVPGKPYTMPRNGGWYTLTPPAGRETLYVLASATRLTALEALLGAAAVAPPAQRIRMKLSADSLHEDESFALVLQTVTEDLRRGPSFAHRLGRQTFGSPTGLLQEVVQFACRLKDGLEPARSQRFGNVVRISGDSVRVGNATTGSPASADTAHNSTECGASVHTDNIR